MNKRMFRRKAQKAGRGEFVGEPVPLGFIVPVTGHKPNGQYEYGKYAPYQPHAEVAEHLLREYVRLGWKPAQDAASSGGSCHPVLPAGAQVHGAPEFTEEMHQTRQRLRDIAHLVAGLATNPKLIGVWSWGSGEPIIDNHPPACPRAFLEAFEIASRNGKPKGRAADSEPLEWQGILQCANHSEARKLISRSRHHGLYSCDLDYRHAKSQVACLCIDARDMDGPLSTAVLGQLELGPCIEDIISRLEDDASSGRVDRTRDRHEISRLEKRVAAYKAFLPCCVDEGTGKVEGEGGPLLGRDKGSRRTASGVARQTSAEGRWQNPGLRRGERLPQESARQVAAIFPVVPQSFP